MMTPEPFTRETAHLVSRHHPHMVSKRIEFRVRDWVLTNLPSIHMSQLTQCFWRLHD